MTPQLAHVPLPMPWIQISLQCCESCKNKPPCIPAPESTRTGAQRLHTSCSICPVIFAKEHRESCLSCTSLVYWWGLLHKRWLLQQQKQPDLGRWESARSLHQSSPGKIQSKHLGWNSWRLSAGTSSFQTVWMGQHTWNSSRTCFRCSWRRYPLQYTEKCCSNMMSLQCTQPESTSTSEQVYREKWIGRGGPLAWPAKLPDQTPLDFFILGNVKSVVYISPVNTRQELIERIFIVFNQIRQSSDI